MKLLENVSVAVTFDFPFLAVLREFLNIFSFVKSLIRIL